MPDGQVWVPTGTLSQYWVMTPDHSSPGALSSSNGVRYQNRVVQWHERGSRDIAFKKEIRHTGVAGGDEDLLDAQPGRTPSRRHDQDVEVEPMPDQQEDADDLERFGSALCASRKQDSKRYGPVHHEIQVKEKEPPLVGALDVMRYLFRNVPVPHQQVLACPDVGPESDKGEQHLAQIMELVLVDDVAEKTAFP